MVSSKTNNPAPIIHTATPAGRGTATSYASQVDGTWLAAQAQQAINNMRVHRAFDEARDPYLKRQLEDADLGKTESQRRDEQTGEGDARTPRSNEQSDGSVWLAALRDTAMKKRAHPARSEARGHDAPARASPSRHRGPSL